MLRTSLRGQARAFKLPFRTSLTAPARRPYFTAPDPTHYWQVGPRVRVLGPTLWSLGAVAIIYFSAAVYEVHRDAKAAKALRAERYVYIGARKGPLSYAEVEDARAAAFAKDLRAQRRAPVSSPYDVWSRLTPTETGRFLLGTAGLTTGIFAISYVPSVMQRLIHIPALPHNYTLLTSMFAHAGALHLAFNMYGLLTFGPAIAQSRTFERSSSHLAAFYVSSGILAGLAHHISSAVVPAQRPAALVGSLGASGAIFALVAAYALQYPEAKVGILFLPFEFQAQQALAGLALFDLYGVLVGFRAIRFAHGAHLGGMAIGSAYVAFDGNRRIWRPTRRLAFKVLQTLNMV